MAFSFKYNSAISGLATPSGGDWVAVIFLGATSSSFIKYALNTGQAMHIYDMIDNGNSGNVNAGLYAICYLAGYYMYIMEIFLNGTTFSAVG